MFAVGKGVVVGGCGCWLAIILGSLLLWTGAAPNAVRGVRIKKEFFFRRCRCKIRKTFYIKLGRCTFTP